MRVTRTRTTTAGTLGTVSGLRKEVLEPILAGAAQGLAASPDPRERDLEAALIAELEREFPGRVKQQLTVVPRSWEGRVGPADIALEHPDRAPTLIEVKLGSEELAACAWDTAKLAALVAEEQASYALLIAAAPSATWAEGALGSELFHSQSWNLEDLLARFARWFSFWREDIANYPKRLPARWETSAVARSDLLVGAGAWEIRAASIGEVSGTFLPLAYSPQVASWKRGAPAPANELQLPAQEIEGDLIARYRSRQDAVDELGPLERAGRGEGYAALIRSDHQLVLDEGTMRDFLPEGDQGMTLVQALAFSSPTARRAALARRRLLRSLLHPDALRIETTDGMGAGASRLHWDGDRLQVEAEVEGRQHEAAANPKLELWSRLWSELDRLDVWDWWPSYRPERMATDGPSWSATISKGGRLLESRGYMAYPERGGVVEAPGSEWQSFKAAVRDLSGVLLT